MDKLAIGKIGGAFGVRGFNKIASLSGETDHFFTLNNVSLIKNGIEREIRIEEVKPYKTSNLLIKFEGIDSPEKARELTGMEIWVPREQAAQCGEGEYYYADLCGCSMYREGNFFGKVKDVCDTNTGQLLEVAIEGKNPVLIPFTDSFIGDVNIREQKIELLLDVVS